MRLTDIMSNAGLALFPQIGLLIFLAVFACIVARVYSRRRAADFDRWATLALQDDAPLSGTGPRTSRPAATRSDAP